MITFAESVELNRNLIREIIKLKEKIKELEKIIKAISLVDECKQCIHLNDKERSQWHYTD